MIFKRLNKKIRTILLILFVSLLYCYSPANTKADEPYPISIYLPLIQGSDLISGYISSVDLANLTSYTSNLVTQYAPRHHKFDRVFIDRACTLGGDPGYNDNLTRSSKYVKEFLYNLGYPFTKEWVDDGSGGYNVVATKIGSVYPSVYIEIGAHIDTKVDLPNTPRTPGASDNAAGLASVMEIARILQNYPNRYSFRFISFIGEEYGLTGSEYHVNQIYNNGEQIKAALIMDGIGWSETAPDNMNCIWDDGTTENRRIANLFNAARTRYNIDINWRLCSPYPLKQVSDNVSYWNQSYTAVLSIGGLPYQDPNYHQCTDDMIAVNMQNAFKTTQENLAVAILLDQESWTGPLQPAKPLTLPIPWIGEGH